MAPRNSCLWKTSEFRKNMTNSKNSIIFVHHKFLSDIFYERSHMLTNHSNLFKLSKPFDSSIYSIFPFAKCISAPLHIPSKPRHFLSFSNVFQWHSSGKLQKYRARQKWQRKKFADRKNLFPFLHSKWGKFWSENEKNALERNFTKSLPCIAAVSPSFSFPCLHSSPDRKFSPFQIRHQSLFSKIFFSFTSELFTNSLAEEVAARESWRRKFCFWLLCVDELFVRAICWPQSLSWFSVDNQSWFS